MTVSTLPTKDPSLEIAARSAPESRLFGKLHFVAVFILLQLLAILCAEGILFLAGVGEEDLTTFDFQLGFRHRENKRTTWRQEGYSQSFFGVDGLREPAASQKSPGTYRVMLLGDSFVEGLQEPHEFSFGEQLERSVAARVKQPVEVLNFGTVGFSTVQEYLLLERMMPKYHPDAVVLCYTPRDMAETLETWAPANMKPVGSRPFALKMPDKPLEISNLPVLNFAQLPATKLQSQFEWLRQNSRLWGYFSANKPKLALKNALVDIVAQIVHNPVEGLHQLVKPVMSSASPSFQIQFFEQSQKKQQTARSAKESAALNKRSDLNFSQDSLMRTTHLRALDDTFGELLKAMQTLCAKNKTELMVLITPCKLALVPPDANGGLPPALYNVTYDEERAFVKSNCDALKIPMMDCHSLAAAKSADQIKGMFFLHHPNRVGNKFLSDNMNEFFVEKITKARTY
jgi:hypothetical protein